MATISMSQEVLNPNAADSGSSPSGKHRRPLWDGRIARQALLDAFMKPAKVKLIAQSVHVTRG